MCSTRPCGPATMGVDKGYTETLGDRLATESDQRKVKGQRRNRLRAVAEKHAAKGPARPATSGGTTSATKSGTGGSPCTTDRCATTSARPPTPSWTRPAPTPARTCPHEVRQVPSPGHQPPPERVGQGHHGGHPHFDISTQRFCAGLGQSGLHIANRPPHGPVAGHALMGSVLLSRQGWVGRGHQCRLQHSGEAVRRGDYVVHALQGPTGRSRPCSRNEPGQRWGLLHPDSSCGPHQPRAKYPQRCRSVPIKGTAAVHMALGLVQAICASAP